MEDNISVVQIDCDVRAEVVAANLVENIDYPIDKISINNKGNKSRRYRKDILKVETRESRLGNTEMLNFDVSRSGIYDLLPQGFFHGKNKGKKNKTSSEVVEEFKRNREEEEAVRLFFQPVEKELNRVRILTELKERETVFQLDAAYQSNLFLKLFPDLDSIPPEYQSVIIQILPIVNKIRGNGRLIALLCETLFKVPAAIVSLRQFRLLKNTSGSNGLGRTFVGENFVLGNLLPDYSPEIEIRLGPMDKEDALKFLPGREYDKLVGFIRKYLIPFDAEIKFSFVFHENQKGLYLRESHQTDRVGLNTYL